MSETGAPIPFIFCGLNPAMGKVIKGHLLPDYEPVIFINSHSLAHEVIPKLIENPTQEPELSQKFDAIATYDFSTPAKAIVFGAGFQDVVREIHAQSTMIAGAPKVPMLFATKRDLSGGRVFASEQEQTEAFGAILSERILRMLNELREKGKLGNDDGLYEF